MTHEKKVKIMKPKYKISINQLETKGEIEKLRRDGFTREDISKALYRETKGLDQDSRSDMMKRLHDRR